MSSKHRNIVWFVLGPIGAGKTTYIQRVTQTEPLVYLSPDQLLHDQHLTYHEAREQMGELIQQHIDQQIPIIVEGTGQHDELYDLFLESQRNPIIQLKVTFIDIDFITALKRNQRRERVLPEEIVRQVYQRCYERREKWKEFGCLYVNYESLL